MVFGRAMAIETPAHRHRLGHVDLAHQVNAPVAADAPDVAMHVNGVIEEHEVRHIVDSLP